MPNGSIEYNIVSSNGMFVYNMSENKFHINKVYRNKIHECKQKKYGEKIKEPMPYIRQTPLY